ncbi:hypothetical protein EJB05_48670, partial [Eragrostis curvula]
MDEDPGPFLWVRLACTSMDEDRYRVARCLQHLVAPPSPTSENSACSTSSSIAGTSSPSSNKYNSYGAIVDTRQPPQFSPLCSKYYTSNIETMMELGIFSCVLLKRKLIVEDDLTESLPSAAHVQMIIIKATGLDGTIPPAWVGAGIAYAAQDEGDQAMVVFRTAVRLFHGCHLPTLYMGMQYLGMHNSKLAKQVTITFYFLSLLIISSSWKKNIYNELGVVAYNMKE